MIIKARNLLDQTAQETALTQTEAIGTGTLHVVNANGFADAQWAVQLGKTGEEKTEITLLSSGTPSGTTLTLAGTIVFDHPQDTPVYAVKYDQIVWKRSTSGTGGTASAFATTNITPDDIYSQYDDTSGLTTYAYKAAFLNSALGSVSSDSDWITPSGYDFYSLANIRQRVKDKLFSTGFIGDDSIIDGWVNEYLEMMTNAAIDVNKDYNMGSTTVAFAAGQELGTITDADFKQIRLMWFVSGQGTSVVTNMSARTPRPGQVFNITDPYYRMIGDNVISLWPSDTAGTASILYYKLNPVLSNETDTLPVSMRGYTKGFVDYGLAMAYYKDNKDALAQAKEGQAMNLVEKFKNEITPRDKSGPQYMDIVETVGDDVSEFWYR